MRICLTLITLCLTGMLCAQVPGSILDPASPAINPLNPNGDGFITSTNTAFSGTLDEAEFELAFIPFQQYQSEPGSDNQYAAGCEFYELVNDPTAGAESAYFYYTDPDAVPDNGDELLFFRFRVARYSNGSTAFSVFVDTDYLFGPSGPEADPNALPGNPGFEREIAVYNSTGSSGGVRVFNVDGMDTATVVNFYASITSHYQVSYALNQEAACTALMFKPVFVDMFIPFSALGISSTTQVRMAVAVNEDINSSLGGGASDIGGVNGAELPNDDDQFIAAISHYSPIALGNNSNAAPLPTDADVSVDENLANGSFVHTVAASDPNANTLTYSITGGNTSSAFVIDGSTGDISVNNSVALDAETTPVFTLVVRVSDGLLYDNAIITVNLKDVNESAPALADASTFVNENTANGSVVYDMDGVDPDKSAVLTYLIIEGNTGQAFNIDNTSGVITVNSVLDFETHPIFILSVRVSDGAFYDDALITIQLVDVNEPPTASDATVSLDENSPAGTVVHQVSARDADADAILNYTISTGSAASAFTINSASGAITVSDPLALDFESNPSFALTVRVSDGSFFSDAIILINLNDVNEPPVVTDASLLINTWLTTGDVVYSLVALDPDADDVLTYGIESGNIDEVFAMDSKTGALKIQNVEHLKISKRYFDLEVSATDLGGLKGRGRIEISIERIPGRSDIRPYKGFSPNNDRKNDFWIIEGIEAFPINSVLVVNRWGIPVYETQGYDNNTRIWSGEGQGAAIDVETTYFYRIQAGDFEPITGYLIVKP